MFRVIVNVLSTQQAVNSGPSKSRWTRTELRLLHYVHMGVIRRSQSSRTTALLHCYRPSKRIFDAVVDDRVLNIVQAKYHL